MTAARPPRGPTLNPVNSCLYECSVLHARLAPRRHRFVYRIFLFAIDLDELGELHRDLRWFSAGSRNLYSFRDADFFPSAETLHQPTGGPAGARGRPAPGAGLKQRVEAWLAGRGIDIAGGRVLLVTLPRVAGYLFNPVSFYFCFDRTGRPVASIAEVTNTFREIKPYLVGPDAAAAGDAGVFRVRVPKHFYVSPFSDTDVAFDFQLRAPGGRLEVQIDDYAGGERVLTSSVQGERRELTDSQLLRVTARHPLVTLRIITLIHWHALRLWLKRVPWFAKAARGETQRDLYRPHASLTNRPRPTAELANRAPAAQTAPS